MAAKPATPPASLVDELDGHLARELLAGMAGPAPLAPGDHDGPHRCPACDRAFVEAGDERDVASADAVLVSLRCVNCGWTAGVTRTPAELAWLDRQHEGARADLEWTLEILWLANEEHAIGCFAAALAADAVLPEDF